MRPDKRIRFDRWLTRSKARAAVVRLVARHVTQDDPVQQWEREEFPGLDVALLLDVADDHCEQSEESTEFQAECLDAEGVVFATRSFTSYPAGEDGKQLSMAALNAHKSNSADKIVQHFMAHDTAKTKILVTFLGTALEGMQKLQQINQAQLEKLDQRNARLEATIEAILLKRESAADLDEQEEAALTVEAISKLTGLAKEAAPHLLAYIESRVHGNGAAGGGEGGGEH